MSDRVTKRDIVAAFARAFPPESRASNFGGDTPGVFDNRHNIGKLALDYNSAYGGWVIITYVGGTSGMGSAEGNPYGCRGRAGRAMLDFLDGIAAGRAL